MSVKSMDWCEMKNGADLNLLGLQMQHLLQTKSHQCNNSSYKKYFNRLLQAKFF
jgi:hypothetical protein